MPERYIDEARKKGWLMFALYWPMHMYEKYISWPLVLGLSRRFGKIHPFWAGAISMFPWWLLLSVPDFSPSNTVYGFDVLYPVFFSAVSGLSTWGYNRKRKMRRYERRIRRSSLAMSIMRSEMEIARLERDQERSISDSLRVRLEAETATTAEQLLRWPQRRANEDALYDFLMNRPTPPEPGPGFFEFIDEGNEQPWPPPADVDINYTRWRLRGVGGALNNMLETDALDYAARYADQYHIILDELMGAPQPHTQAG